MEPVVALLNTRVKLLAQFKVKLLVRLYFGLLGYLVLLKDYVITCGALMEEQILAFDRLVSYLDGLRRGRLLGTLTISFEVSESLDNLCFSGQTFAYYENFFRWIHSIFS